MERKVLTGLQANTYEHPFDRKALNALHGTPGLEILFKKLNEYGIEKMYQIQYTGSNIKVSDNNFPALYSIFKHTCEILDLGYLPELYIQWGYQINAMAIGAVHPMIVLNSGCVDLLTEDELMFVIGHEVGHLKSQHQLYHQMASVIPILGEVVGTATLGLGGILSQGLVMALLYWQRMSEFTADRAGLLACQDLVIASQATMKMAGVPQKYFSVLNVNDFIQQAKSFEGYDFNSMNRLAKAMIIMQQSHPWTVMRAAEVFKWADSGTFEQIVQHPTLCGGEGQRINSNICAKCGFSLSDHDMFCSKCGTKVMAGDHHE